MGKNSMTKYYILFFKKYDIVKNTTQNHLNVEGALGQDCINGGLGFLVKWGV